LKINQEQFSNIFAPDGSYKQVGEDFRHNRLSGSLTKFRTTVRQKFRCIHG